GPWGRGIPGPRRVQAVPKRHAARSRSLAGPWPRRARAVTGAVLAIRGAALAVVSRSRGSVAAASAPRPVTRSAVVMPIARPWSARRWGGTGVETGDRRSAGGDAVQGSWSARAGGDNRGAGAGHTRNSGDKPVALGRDPAQRWRRAVVRRFHSGS